MDPNENNMETEGNDKDLDSSTKLSPLELPLLRQRPTQPCGLDPDRAQIPSENMNYIRHFGLLPSELLSEQRSI